jgi:hypothetical protein
MATLALISFSTRLFVTLFGTSVWRGGGRGLVSRWVAVGGVERPEHTCGGCIDDPCAHTKLWNGRKWVGYVESGVMNE